MTKAVFFVKGKTESRYREYAMAANEIWFSRSRIKGYGSQWSKWSFSNVRFSDRLDLSIGDEFEDRGNYYTVADPSECKGFPKFNSVARIELAICELDKGLITHVEFAETIKELLSSNISIIEWHKADGAVDQEFCEPMLIGNSEYPYSVSLANFIKDGKFGHTSEKWLSSPTHFAWMPKGPKGES